MVKARYFHSLDFTVVVKNPIWKILNDKQTPVTQHPVLKKEGSKLYALYDDNIQNMLKCTDKRLEGNLPIW